MRKLILSTVTVAVIAGTGAVSPAKAQPQGVVNGPYVETVQYYEPGWREREEWHRRREIEMHRRAEWHHRAEWRHQRERFEDRRFEEPRYYGPRF